MSIATRHPVERCLFPSHNLPQSVPELNLEEGSLLIFVSLLVLMNIFSEYFLSHISLPHPIQYTPVLVFVLARPAPLPRQQTLAR